MNRSSVSIIVVWLIFVGVCISVVTRSSFSTDLEAFLPEAPTPAQQLLVDQLRDGIVSRLLLVAVEGDNEERLSASVASNSWLPLLTPTNAASADNSRLIA